MDKNCINTAICFVPSSEVHFDVRCGSVNPERNLLAVGTEQGVIVLYEIKQPESKILQFKGSLKRFKKHYESKNGLSLQPLFFLLSNNNHVSFPVVQVEFAKGGNFTSTLNVNKDSSRDFKPFEFGEDILISLQEDSTLCVWSLTSFRCLHKIRGPPFEIRSIKVLPDRRFLAVVGDKKVNIIDLWSIKLVETLQIEKANDTTSSEDSSDSGSSCDPSDIVIIETSCSCNPEKGLMNLSKVESFPIIFVAITSANEVLLWDLTHSIISHKASEPSFNGPVKVISEWDSLYDLNSPILSHKSKNKHGSSRVKKRPTVREYVHELENERGKVEVIDNYVLLMVGYRILVWFYETHELTRTAEILSFCDDSFNESCRKWAGLKCVKNHGENYLCCWLRNGKMRIYLAPKVNSSRNFSPFASLNFPKFIHNHKHYELYFTRNNDLFYIIFNKNLYYSMDGFGKWQTHRNVTKIHDSNEVKNTILFERLGNLSRIELFSNGNLCCTDLSSFKSQSLTSPNVFLQLLNNMDRCWKYSNFIITEGINHYLHQFKNDQRCELRYIIHSTGQYLLVGVGKSVVIYSLRCLKFKLYINQCHFFKIRSFHNIYNISSGEGASELVELPSCFCTIDTEGYLVIYNVSELVKNGKDNNSDHLKIDIEEDVIYKSSSIQLETDFDLDLNNIVQSKFFIYLKTFKGLNRINSMYQLKNAVIDRIGMDKNRDLLFVLTSTSVLIWRLSLGDFIANFSQLSQYRQSILSSTQANLNASLENGNSELTETKPSNYSSSPLLFMERFKKKLSSNLYVSQLTLSFNVSALNLLYIGEVFEQKRFSISKGGVKRSCTWKLRSRSNVISNKDLYSFPLVIFPFEFLFKNSKIDFLTIAKDCLFSFLGVPNGTFTIPLNDNFRRDCYDLIRTRTNCTQPSLLPVTFSPNQTTELCSYQSTTSYFLKSFLSKSFSNRVGRGNLIERRNSLNYDESTVNKERVKNLDIWLLITLMMSIENNYEWILESLRSNLNSLRKDELDLHVTRALANIHVSQSYKLTGKANLPQIHICNCNSTVFTFGSKCGSCQKTKCDFEYNYVIKHLRNVNEDSSLILLALVSVDNYLYSLKTTLRFGVKCYSLSSYVVQQLMLKLLSLDDVANTEENKPGFQLKTFLLDILAQGFGVVWNLSTFSKHSILPDQIRRNKYSLLFREDFHQIEEISMDTAYFILYLFQHYHHSKNKSWTKLLLLSCSQNTPLSIDIIGWIVKKKKLSNKAIITALKLIVEFMDSFNELGLMYLPDFVSIIIKCLDPMDYNIRIMLLKHATNALFYLVKNVPMVDFHQDTQRFAVGSQAGYIIIYDIRTATKWRMFLGNQSQIACIAFGSNGNLIAAYYNQIPLFMVWKCSSSGLIGSLLSNTNKELKCVKLKTINTPASFNQLRNVKIQYKSGNKWFLHREDGRGYMIST